MAGRASPAGAPQLSFSPENTAEGRAQPRRQIKDPAFLILFILHIVVLIIIGSAKSSAPRRYGWFKTPSQADSLQVKLAVGAILASLAGVGWTFVVFSTFRPKILYFSQALAGFLLAVHALIMFATGHWGVGLGLLLLVAGDTLWMLHARPRVRFVEVLLDVIVTALRRRQKVVYVALGATVLQCVYLIMWARLLVTVLAAGSGGSGDIFLIVLLLASLRWTCGLLKHIVTVTVAGTFAVWLNATANSTRTTFTYDLDEDLGIEFGMDDTQPTMDVEHAPAAGDEHDSRRLVGAGATSAAAPAERPGTPFIKYSNYTATDFLMQALTSSLGSVCAGSLIGVFSPVLWALHRASRRCERARTRRVHRWAMSCSAGIDAVLRRSHKYAYTQVATKGKSWFSSARDTWKSFMTRGVEGVVYDDCSDRLLLFSCYIGGSLLALVLGVTIHAGTTHWFLTAVVVFWFGFVGVGMPLTVMEGSVSSLFVCFSEVPQSLSNCHPIIYHRFVRISELRHFRRVHGDDGDDDL